MVSNLAPSAEGAPWCAKIRPEAALERRLGGRTSATMASVSRDRLGVPPDETASREALGRGVRDAGEALALALLTDYRSSGPARH